jgi:hypothetical protein
MGCMGWGYKKISRRVGGCFLVIQDLRWDMTLRLDPDMTYSIGIRPLRKIFKIYIVLIALRMLM